MGFFCFPGSFAAIKGLGDLTGKKFLPFVTMGFFHPAMGGKQAVALMQKTAAAAGAKVLPGKIIPRMFHDFTAQIEKAAAEIAALVVDGSI